MALEELIYKRIKEYQPVVGLLAQYAGGPAIFYPVAPADADSGWNGERFPHVCYTLDRRADKERQNAGRLVIRLYCLDGTPPPEEIEPKLRECLCGVLMKPEENLFCCFSWAGTSVSDVRKEGVSEREIIFDMLDYPAQETTDPDPVSAMNQYLKCLYPDSRILWYDEMEPVTVTDLYTPVFYCRLESVDKSRETNTVVWISGRIAVYLLYTDADTRMKMMTAAAHQLCLEGEVIMLDRSPMSVKQIQLNHHANYRTEGQMILTVEYGLLRRTERRHGLEETRIIVGKESNENGK